MEAVAEKINQNQKCQILELFKTEYYIDEMSVQKYPSLAMSDFDRMDCW